MTGQLDVRGLIKNNPHEAKETILALCDEVRTLRQHLNPTENLFTTPE